jgi:hypothetical protein
LVLSGCAPMVATTLVSEVFCAVPEEPPVAICERGFGLRWIRKELFIR